jgi:hypothetical protein
MDAETAARHYLVNALASEELPTFTAAGLKPKRAISNSSLWKQCP